MAGPPPSPGFPAGGSVVLTVNAGSSSLKLRVVGADGSVEASADLPRSGRIPSVAQYRDSSPTLLSSTPWATGSSTGARFRGPCPCRRRGRGCPRAAGRPGSPAQPPGCRRNRRDAPTPSRPAPGGVLRHRVPCRTPGRGGNLCPPHEWNSRWHLRRYGFHGLSHAHAASRGADLLAPVVPPLPSALDRDAVGVNREKDLGGRAGGAAVAAGAAGQRWPTERCASSVHTWARGHRWRPWSGGDLSTPPWGSRLWRDW